jgi:threonine dehydrogenase-like Zn-dependent dehydrogenase
MMNVMKALLYQPDFSLAVVELESPEPGAGELLVRVEAAGICGSDVHGVAARSDRRRPPLVMGHEVAGRVEAGGPGAPTHLVGRRVAVNPQVPCRACLSCRSGGENVCPHRGLVGGTRAGGFADLVSVPATCVHLVSEGLDAGVAVLAEPLATCVHGMRLAESVLPETVVVLGAGPIGMLAASVARRVGAHTLIVSEVDPERRAQVARIADLVVAPHELDVAVSELTAGAGAELSIDAVGVDAARRASVSVLAARGTALWLGMHDTDATVPAFDLVVREQRVQGAFAYTDADFARAVGLLEREPEAFAVPGVTFPLAEGDVVFGRLLAGDTAGVLKATLVP